MELVKNLEPPGWGRYEVTCFEEGDMVVEGDGQGGWGEAGRDKEGRVRQWYEDKGWTVRGGLAYGCDYVLYRGSPDLYHSEYAVMVADPEDPPEWAYLQNLVRLMDKVHKQLLVCLSSSEAETPISDFSMSRSVFAESQGQGVKRKRSEIQ
eukprot:TRINITY_DN1647_c0_g2_i1.p1 TRINITY_DN1647_c0_g2~~TRINITY_DN1647_c0_g2_i1.p1  ORF type:complete len:151 (+),score=18.19 TRINITY_DN1647_c0_g2_i1:28-480(+)